MRILFQKRSYTVLGALLLIIFAAYFAFTVFSPNENNTVSIAIERGNVTETVAVSGFVEAKNTAELAFPSVGKVTEVFVSEGDTVEAGEVLATLGSAQLAAERSEAAASLRLAAAQLDETLAGASAENVNLALTKVNNAEAALARTITEEEQKVENAKEALLSNQLSALSLDEDEDATAPTITGTYSCDEGSYEISVYKTTGRTGYAYNFTGLESGNNVAFIDQPGAFGDCGLFIQFDDGGGYAESNWVINIPNTKASNYVTYKNAYDLAVEQKNNAVAAAENTLQLAKEEAGITTASARTEVIDQKQAAVAQARARLASIDAKLADRSIVAPFTGMVTDVSVISGETVTSNPVITMLAEDAFELKARVPEIDITKINQDQRVTTVFDAKTDETIGGYISYISPLATEIDGVAYFKTTITLDQTPVWLRSGLNADIDIITQEKIDTLRLPKRYLLEENGQYYVMKSNGNKPVTVEFIGNDGYAALSGVNEGEVVIAP